MRSFKPSVGVLGGVFFFFSLTCVILDADAETRDCVLIFDSKGLVVIDWDELMCEGIVAGSGCHF